MVRLIRGLVVLLVVVLAMPAPAAVSSTSSRQSYTADSSTKVFAFSFPVLSASHVEVYVGGVRQATGFTTAVNANQSTSPGGTVTFSVAPGYGLAVKIQRSVPLTQDSTWSPYTPFQAKVLEKQLDRLVMQQQQLSRDTNDYADSLAAQLRSDFQAGTGGFTDSALVLAPGTTTSESFRAIAGKVFRPEQFGAKCDGATDDYLALQSLVAAVNAKGGGVVEFPAKATCKINRYIVSGGVDANGITNLTFTSVNGLTIRGNGAKLDVTGAFTLSDDYTVSTKHYTYRAAVGLVFTRGSNIVVRDLEIDLNNQDTTKVAGVVESPSYPMAFLGSSYVTLDGVYLHHSQTDGLLIRDTGGSPATICKHFEVKNSTFDYNARQGMSITALRWGIFTNDSFTNTGQGTFYYAPAGGVDFEPDRWPGASAGGAQEADDFHGDVSFIRCHFENNGGSEFVGTADNKAGTVGPTIYPVTFTDCDFIGRVGQSSRVIHYMKYASFTRCLFKDVAFMPQLGAGPNNHSRTLVDDSVFESSDPAENIIKWGDTSYPGELIIRNSKVRLSATSVKTTSVPRIFASASGSARLAILGNYIWVSTQEWVAEAGHPTYSALAQLEGGLVDGNSWDTDFAGGGTNYWFISYTGSTVRSDRYINVGQFGALSLPTTDAYYDQGRLGTAVLELGDGTTTYTKRKLLYRTAAPTTGTWSKGDLTINSNPASSSSTWAWMCTAAGTPGTWTPMAPIGMVQAATKADVASYSGVPGALANAATLVDLNALRAELNALMANLRTAKLQAP